VKRTIRIEKKITEQTMEKKTTTKEKATTSKKKKAVFTMPTLLQAIERVVTLSEDSKMSEDIMMQAAPELGFLADSFGITERQALLFCVCMEKGPRCVEYDDLASYLGMNKIRILNYANDIDALIGSRFYITGQFLRAERWPNRERCPQICH
jgi:hypothetical protein